MALSVKPSHLKRYKDVVRLLAKYADPEMIKGARLDEGILLEEEETGQAIAKGSPEKL